MLDHHLTVGRQTCYLAVVPQKLHQPVELCGIAAGFIDAYGSDLKDLVWKFFLKRIPHIVHPAALPNSGRFRQCGSVIKSDIIPFFHFDLLLYEVL